MVPIFYAAQYKNRYFHWDNIIFFSIYVDHTAIFICIICCKKWTNQNCSGFPSNKQEKIIFAQTDLEYCNYGFVHG